MNETNNPAPRPVFPASLKKGDTIGLVRPAGPILSQDTFTAGIRILKKMGFEVRFSGESQQSPERYLAGTDKKRASEFNDLWADPEVKALVAVRGGYGSLRMVDRLNIDLIQRHPKIIIGFSDISVLLTSIAKKTGLVTFHGPMLTTLARSDQESIQFFFHTLTGSYPSAIKVKELEILRPGQAQGRLIGGNLTSLVHLLATCHELSWDNAIVFLEDVGEAPYRIDRILTQLYQANRLRNLAGLILGSFSSISIEDDPDGYDYESVWNRIIDLFSKQEIPIWANFPVGHGHRNLTLPIGVEAEMDSRNGSLIINSPVTIPS